MTCILGIYFSSKGGFNRVLGYLITISPYIFAFCLFVHYSQSLIDLQISTAHLVRYSQYSIEMQAVSKEEIPDSVENLSYIDYKEFNKTGKYLPTVSYDSEIFNDFKAYVGEELFNEIRNEYNIYYVNMDFVNNRKDQRILGITLKEEKFVIIDDSLETTDKKFKHTLYHELGHIIDDKLDIVKNHMTDIEKDMKNAVKVSSDVKDAYLMSSPSEFFADMFSFYITNKPKYTENGTEKFKEIFPELSEIFDKEVFVVK